MQSQANSDGNLTLTVTFKLGTDPDMAQQLVQNRVAQALPRLPEDVQRLGVTTIKVSPTLTMVVHLISPNNRYDMTYLRNYALINVKDRLARIQGVGEVQLWGSGDYCDARLARSAEGRAARPDGDRCGQRDPRAERSGGSRRDRRIADRCRACRCSCRQCAWPLADRGRIRRHHRQDRAGRRA